MDRTAHAAIHLIDQDAAGQAAEPSSHDAELAQRIRAGLRAGEFSVAYQPVAHAQTLTLLNVECLLRWQHPQYGLLLPECFVSAFDDPLTARAVSEFMLEAVSLQLSEMRQAGQVLPPVTVNIQPTQLLDETLCATIRDTTRRHGIDPLLLELELAATEDAATLLSTQEFTRSLRQLGVRLALNDFGSGYSPLSLLGTARIDTVKLARSFMTRVPATPRDCVVMNGLLDLLERLKIRAVVEGVETEAQLHWLRQRPEVYVQGYHVARPQVKLAAALAFS
ncbi:EAL domain-containing protein [Paraburkholderia phenazinium]|uniref:EAL domain, c-di-GMP-specific phosphodiesterase class I (Or its enzymatically inactive variant) n=1 Tax=Paraburkholderia phenazinium TaxID=60549 RepID=A0A1G8BQD2_9BURK|nr:EAL domain-containing protein [Paraburkholderia phenazinium]SDH35313.1 EAL domain, c-di-GMP-specific phosphodiesterase class I (or its enzymatically inactive variant) [Paraburkholderia phenazinium]